MCFIIVDMIMEMLLFFFVMIILVLFFIFLLIKRYGFFYISMLYNKVLEK